MIALLLSLLVMPAQVQQDPQKEVRELVEKLRSENPQEREKAALMLEGIEKAAIPTLEKAVTDPDTEVAQRARQILRTIEFAQKLTPALKKAFPGVQLRLLSDRGHAWAGVFLEAVAEKAGRRLHPTLMRPDIEILTAPAVRHALTTEEQEKVCLAIGWPHILERLVESPAGAEHINAP